MTPGTDQLSLLKQLRDPALAALADEAVRDYVDWDQLAARPLPLGLSRAQVWELLGLIRQFGATTFPVATSSGSHAWYNLNREGTRCLEFIKHHCRADSVLHATTERRAGHRFQVRSRIQEAVATCQLDGIAIPYRRAERMLEDGRAPRSPEERLVLNVYEMLRELESLAPEPFSASLVSGIFDRVSHNVDMSGVGRKPRHSSLFAERPTSDAADPERTEEALAALCDFANGESGDPTEPAVIKGFMIFSAMGYWRPVPDMNETVARHMMRLLAVKRDYPVLGYLSTSLTTLGWVDGSAKPRVTRFAELGRREVVPGSIDATEEVLTQLQLTTAALGGLLGIVERTKREDASLRDVLDRHERLNYRQRSVLTQALANPAAEFRIRPHQAAYRVVYQTARTDLLDLMERGYLRKETRGKGFVFVTAPDLGALVEADSNPAQEDDGLGA